MYYSTPPSTELDNFQNENLLPRRGSNPGHAEPEADMLPSEPARRPINLKFFFFNIIIIINNLFNRNNIFFNISAATRKSKARARAQLIINRQI